MAAALIVQKKVNQTDLNSAPLPESSLELPVDGFVRSGVLERKRVGSTISWHKIKAVLTHDTLFFAKQDSILVSDEIPLHEITDVLTEATLEKGDDSVKKALIIQTTKDGHNSGRTYVCRPDPAEFDLWHGDLQKHCESAKIAQEKIRREAEYSGSQLSLFRARVLKSYESIQSQTLFAAVLIASFVVDVWEAQTLPADGTSEAEMFDRLDVVFTTIFTVELVINLFSRSANFFKAFFTDGWNILDLAIVTVSLTVLFAPGMPMLKPLRLVRVFRVARLFRKLRSLNRIITALVSALIPVANSMVILLLVTSIWSALGTHLFHERSPEYFGNFTSALFTMIQVMTGDSWASAVSRSLLDDGTVTTSRDMWVATFFVSYALLAGVFLINVVVAVLLDEFISSLQAGKDAAQAAKVEEEDRKKKARRSGGVLDPLTAHLSHFVSEKDLTSRISETYERLDTDGSGGLNFEEFQKGLKKLPTSSPIHLLEDDYEILTENGKLCNTQKEFGSDQFQEIMREELKRYSQRVLANAMHETQSYEMLSIMLTLKRLELLAESSARIISSWGFSSKGTTSLLEVFQAHDQNRDGVLDLDEARDALAELGIPEFKINYVISKMDGDGDAKISKEEFMHVGEHMENTEARLDRLELSVNDIKSMMSQLVSQHSGEIRPASSEAVQLSTARPLMTCASEEGASQRLKPISNGKMPRVKRIASFKSLKVSPRVSLHASLHVLTALQGEDAEQVLDRLLGQTSKSTLEDKNRGRDKKDRGSDSRDGRERWSASGGAS
eukprot:764013-Hanusia_phi.AAC.1